ncbi:hypothetical protein CSAL01_09551 [Colletotrichum salicis]|uniref:Cytochrome P450 n=1 Tax=Colletotrichum salicis TaxID=1209931 RepID=A0A135SYE4_9PEZI|nr:hypothetical protein CSAL01_09551 [Colletotrichum salicis]
MALLKTITGSRGDLEFYKVTKKYGCLTRIGPNDLLNDDPVLMRHMLGVRSAYRRSAERFGSGGKVQRDMLGSFVTHGLTQEEAESEILLQIIAGSDTTATEIRATLLYVMTKPPRPQQTPTRNRPIITDAEARNLPYLQAVIKEGLRIFPPVVGLMAKQTPPEGDTWNGAFIPGGTRVWWSAWAMFRRQDVFGDDADEFRPERWLAEECEDGLGGIMGGISASDDRLR